MTLTRESLQFLQWLRRATSQLLGVDRAATAWLIVSIIAHQIATMLAFFLPLKVILLVGSPGIPRYFRFFVTDETRDVWVVVLATATFVFFLLAQYLESVIERYSERGAVSLRSSTNQVPIASNESALTESTYHKITESTAKTAFAILALTAGLVFFPALFGFILALLVAEFWLVSHVAGDLNKSPLSGAAHYVRGQTRELLKLLKSVNTLTVFAFLLATFLVFDGINLLIAIASIMLSRQLLGALGDVVKNAMKLVKDRHQVDALVFPHAQLGEANRRAVRELRDRFDGPRRLDRIHRLGQGVGSLATGSPSPSDREVLEGVAESVWVDSGNGRLAIFDLYGPGGAEAGERVLREYVYPAKGGKGLEQHDYLVGRLDEDSLRCLRRVASYEEDGFLGRVVDYRGIDTVDGRTWRDARPRLLAHFWPLPLPDDLMRSFVSARPLLAARVGESLPERLWMAGDEPWARLVYDQLTAQLDDLCDRVGRLPLSLCNHRLSRNNAVRAVDGEVRLVSWNSWGLEPVGAGFDPQRDGVELLSQAGQVAGQRGDSGDGAAVPLADVLAAATLYHLEYLVHRHRPKAALEVAQAVLPLLHMQDAELLAALEAKVASAEGDEPLDMGDVGDSEEADLEDESVDWDRNGHGPTAEAPATEGNGHRSPAAPSVERRDGS